MVDSKTDDDSLDPNLKGPGRAPPDDAPTREPDENLRGGFTKRLGDSLLHGLMDSGAAFKRGQDLVTEIAGGTKEEFLRLAGAELRTFLDKMDVVDLAREIASGLVLDVTASVRIRRDETGKLRPEVDGETQFRSAPGGPSEPSPAQTSTPSPVSRSASDPETAHRENASKLHSVDNHEASPTGPVPRSPSDSNDPR